MKPITSNMIWQHHTTSQKYKASKSQENKFRPAPLHFCFLFIDLTRNLRVFLFKMKTFTGTRDPTNIYLFKFNNRKLVKEVNYVQSLQ